MSTAVISCDLDTVDRHLHGYGIHDASRCDLIYRKALPRLMELLEELDIRATMFVIGEDAGEQRTLLRELVSAGHEIASHSMSHPEPFRVLDDEALRYEVGQSRAVLAEASGEDVIGFRAPGWDVDQRVLDALRAAGYSYDASVFPSPALFLNRLAMFLKSRSKASLFRMELLGMGSRAPHRRRAGDADLIEFPVAVSRWVRFPVYHTLAYLVPGRVFDRALDAMLRERLAFGYQFHAVDLLDLERDGVDARLGRHPGMRQPLDRKVELLRGMLRKVKVGRELVTYRQAVNETSGLRAAA
ncbi:MAG: hypothetical protein E4H03_14375 [Myxococcales bacterium]|nr:MAG: hypothetical protein E4H03_14375 [Myxococcales bacterium]